MPGRQRKGAATRLIGIRAVAPAHAGSAPGGAMEPPPNMYHGRIIEGCSVDGCLCFRWAPDVDDSRVCHECGHQTCQHRSKVPELLGSNGPLTRLPCMTPVSGMLVTPPARQAPVEVYLRFCAVVQPLSWIAFASEFSALTHCHEMLQVTAVRAQCAAMRRA